MRPSCRCVDSSVRAARAELEGPATFAVVLAFPFSVLVPAALAVTFALLLWVNPGSVRSLARQRDSGEDGASPGLRRAREIAAAERKSARTEIAIGVVLFVIYACALAADRPSHGHRDDAAITIGG